MKTKLYNFKNKYIPNLKKFKASDEDDELGNILGKSQHLGYFTQQSTSTKIVVPIDEVVKDATYYRQVVNAISNTSEDDIIQYEIASDGGSLSGLLALLTANAKTEATKIANINGECHSAASMLALNCDAIYVSPHASMLCHFVSFGTSGKATDIKSHVNHVHNTSEQLFRETYELFLTEEEIEKCINGFELWLDFDEISKRLEYKYSILNEMEEDESKLEELEEQLTAKLAEIKQAETEEAILAEAKPKRSRKPKV